MAKLTENQSKRELLLSLSEENYLKAIFKLIESGRKKITTTSISEEVLTSPASVTDMLQKLAEKKLVNYTRYHGVSLTSIGKKTAGRIVRKHRLWELFLVEKLKFTWDEVHEIAEQLEHIRSESLVERLSVYLGSPQFDPHGDPIPDSNGKMPSRTSGILSESEKDQSLVVSGVKNHSPEFLKHLNKIGISQGTSMLIREINTFDRSMSVQIGSNKKTSFISREIADNILVTQSTVNL